MILAADVGGTKTNCALYVIENNQLIKTFSKQYVSSEYNKFGDIIEHFLQEYSSIDIQAACFGIAGPVIDGKCSTTNLPWETIEINQLQNQLKIKDIFLLNDLSATAYGMLYLNEDEFINLNPNGKNVKATRAVIAAGTGLGEAILYYDGINYHPMATEGGHCDFASNASFEDALLVWLRKRYPEHVSYERILCGEGIHTLYEFLKEYKNTRGDEFLDLNLEYSKDKGALISKFALQNKDSLAYLTMELFCKLYGAKAGNLALSTLSLGGIYIGGGIAPKILPVLQNGVFMNSFLSKGRFRNLLEDMQVKVSLNEETALLGAAYYGRDRIKK